MTSAAPKTTRRFKLDMTYKYGGDVYIKRNNKVIYKKMKNMIKEHLNTYKMPNDLDILFRQFNSDLSTIYMSRKQFNKEMHKEAIDTFERLNSMLDAFLTAQDDLYEVRNSLNNIKYNYEVMGNYVLENYKFYEENVSDINERHRKILRRYIDEIENILIAITIETEPIITVNTQIEFNDFLDFVNKLKMYIKEISRTAVYLNEVKPFERGHFYLYLFLTDPVFESKIKSLNTTRKSNNPDKEGLKEMEEQFYDDLGSLYRESNPDLYLLSENLFNDRPLPEEQLDLFDRILFDDTYQLSEGEFKLLRNRTESSTSYTPYTPLIPASENRWSLDQGEESGEDED